ncbi:hypothetical protein [Marinoscillum sp.]|uniref:hypothetical protein n=1 Tax=Marinoscillum sp. TaxID=2024838 RepID=UPI003BAAE70B
MSRKKCLQHVLLLLGIGFTHLVSGQAATQNLNMGLYQVQFESASGGSNTIQSFGGSVNGTWLFKSRFDHLILDAGVNASNTRKIYFRTGGVDRAILTNTGEFGIGTTTPQTLLDIKATTDNQDLLRLSHPTSPDAAGLIVGFGQNSSSNNNGSVEVKVEFSNAVYDVIGINRYTRDFYYVGDGKVGIGTDAPLDKMHVNGGLVIGAALSFNNATAGPGFNVSGNQQFLHVEGGGLISQNGTQDLGVTGWEFRNLKLSNNAYIGNQMAIGTTVFGGHTLAVEGTIGAREIKVETTTWYDSVFESDYDLAPLQEVENYIKTYKHLSEIPKESEVLENGIYLGEMNAKLLKKIEELTLYVIEINKQVQELKAENQHLKAQTSH